MKKYGFSLAELLITLMIIGIGAAIAVPNISKIMPNQDKAEMIKIYNAINETTEQMLKNSDLYFRREPDKNVTAADVNTNGTFKTTSPYGCIGLNCSDAPKSIKKEQYSPGYRKYPNLLMDMLGLQNISYFGENDSGNGLGNEGQEQTQQSKLDVGTGYFPNGAEFTIRGTARKEIGTGYTITIDMNPSNSHSCTYNKDTCKTPDSYSINVSADGEVTPGDNLLKAYLKNTASTNSKADFDDAEAM